MVALILHWLSVVSVVYPPCCGPGAPVALTWAQSGHKASAKAKCGKPAWGPCHPCVPASCYLPLTPEKSTPQPLLMALNPSLVGVGSSALPGWSSFQLPTAGGTPLAGAVCHGCAHRLFPSEVGGAILDWRWLRCALPYSNRAQPHYMVQKYLCGCFGHWCGENHSLWLP